MSPEETVIVRVKTELDFRTSSFPNLSFFKYGAFIAIIIFLVNVFFIPCVRYYIAPFVCGGLYIFPEVPWFHFWPVS